MIRYNNWLTKFLKFSQLALASQYKPAPALPDTATLQDITDIFSLEKSQPLFP